MTVLSAHPSAGDFMTERLRRWTPAEFRRMAHVGIFAADEPVELVNGEVYEDGRPRLWTRDEYYRLGDTEVFQPDERTELLDGRIIRKVTMNPPHASSVTRTAGILRLIFEPRSLVHTQRPLNLSTRNDPEPDVVVNTGKASDYDYRHPVPAETMLVVEVSDSTLREDRHYKAGLYARAGIAEYWIVNLNARVLEVHRQPIDGEYLEVRLYGEAEAVAPLAAPNAPVRVEDLLPLKRPDPPVES